VVLRVRPRRRKRLRTFAEKKGLASAKFAMGYYAEVGVGGPKDIEAARRWYSRVSIRILVLGFC
jgi:TPR repeat protein